VISAEDLGGGDLHSRKSGVVDHLAENDEHALAIVRDIVARLNTVKAVDLDLAEPVEPKFDPDELYGIIPDDVRTPYDVREVIARIVDGSEFHEFKQLYGTTLVCGFARIWGMPVAILANNGILFRRARSRARISSSSPASGGRPCCSSRTSPASWSAASTKRAASPRTAPSW
jgi:3-methylcrotonyl-CoA carboxylase beta subunit